MTVLQRPKATVRSVLVEVGGVDQEESLTLLISTLLGFSRNGTRILHGSAPPDFAPAQKLLDWHRQHPVDASRGSRNLFPPAFKGYISIPRLFLYRVPNTRNPRHLHTIEDGRNSV